MPHAALTAAVKMPRPSSSTASGMVSGDRSRTTFTSVPQDSRINPRFSASTYLRALAGFNEIDIYLRLLLGLPAQPAEGVREGYYLRGLTEVAAPPIDTPA